MGPAARRRASAEGEGVSATGVSESHWAFARSLDLPAIVGAPVLAAFVTGSLPAGFGTPLSDLDVVAVVADGPETTTWHQGPGFVCSVDRVPAGTLLEHMARVAEAPLPSARYKDAAGYQPSCQRVSRLLVAEPLVEAATLAEWQRSIDTGRLRQLTMTASCVSAVTYVRDAHGALQAGNLLAAHEASVTTLRLVMHAVLASFGDYYVSDKWVTTRWRRAALPDGVREVVLRAIHAAGPAGDDEPQARRSIERRLTLARDLSAYVSLFGFAEPLPALPPHVVEYEGGPSAATAEISAPFSDGILVGGLNAVVLPRLDMLVQFFALRAASYDDLTATLSAVTGEAVPEEFVRSRVEWLATLPSWPEVALS